MKIINPISSQTKLVNILKRQEITQIYSAYSINWEAKYIMFNFEYKYWIIHEAHYERLYDEMNTNYIKNIYLGAFGFSEPEYYLSKFKSFYKNIQKL